MEGDGRLKNNNFGGGVTVVLRDIDSSDALT